jgi:hypothetical protein
VHRQSAIATAGAFYLVIILVQGAAFSRESLVSDLSSFQNATLGSRFAHVRLSVTHNHGNRYIIVIAIIITGYSSALGIHVHV